MKSMLTGCAGVYGHVVEEIVEESGYITVDVHYDVDPSRKCLWNRKASKCLYIMRDSDWKAYFAGDNNECNWESDFDNLPEDGDK